MGQSGGAGGRRFASLGCAPLVTPAPPILSAVIFSEFSAPARSRSAKGIAQREKLVDQKEREREREKKKIERCATATSIISCANRVNHPLSLPSVKLVNRAIEFECGRRRTREEPEDLEFSSWAIFEMPCDSIGDSSLLLFPLVLPPPTLKSP